MSTRMRARALLFSTPVAAVALAAALSLVAMVLAPGLGWIVDMATGQEEVLASWPVATWGLIVGVIAIILSMARSRRAPEMPEQPS